MEDLWPNFRDWKDVGLIANTDAGINSLSIKGGGKGSGKLPQLSAPNTKSIREIAQLIKS